MRMFVLISRFQKPFEEVNRSFASHSAWVQRQLRIWAISRLWTA